MAVPPMEISPELGRSMPLSMLISVDLPLPDFPTMYAYSGPLMESSEKAGDEDFSFLLYGQAAALSRALPAAELMAVLVEETKALLRR